jgi:hypothetical protein
VVVAAVAAVEELQPGRISRSRWSIAASPVTRSPSSWSRLAQRSSRRPPPRCPPPAASAGAARWCRSCSRSSTRSTQRRRRGGWGRGRRPAAAAADARRLAASPRTGAPSLRAAALAGGWCGVVGGGVASHSWKPARAHGALQPSRLRRNARNRRFSRARPLRLVLALGNQARSRTNAANMAGCTPRAQGRREPPTQTHPIRLAENLVCKDQAYIHYHYIRDKGPWERDEKIPTKMDEKIANIFTKGLDKAKLKKFREALSMMCKISLERSLP